ncbi:MAG: hypothetical protein FJ404_00145 [Verrucomicrobia bacterium]|nr:hypothetical protein [Verrucomicrobiota bacterium]
MKRCFCLAALPVLAPTVWAALDVIPSARATGSRGGSVLMGDLGWVILAALGIGVVLVLWAKYLRKPSGSSSSGAWRTSSGRSRSRVGEESPLRKEEVEEEDGEEENTGERGEVVTRRRRKRRRQRRDHRPRNPTLAETGGLPPLKDGTTQPPLH